MNIDELIELEKQQLIELDISDNKYPYNQSIRWLYYQIGDKPNLVKQLIKIINEI